MTFENRPNRYIESLYDLGYFINPVDSIKIYNNGDKETSKGVKVNIKEAAEKGLAGIGKISKGKSGNSIDPRYIVIYPGKGLKFSLLGIDFYSRITINCQFNGDCILQIVEMIIKTGQYLD